MVNRVAPGQSGTVHGLGDGMQCAHRRNCATMSVNSLAVNCDRSQQEAGKPDLHSSGTDHSHLVSIWPLGQKTLVNCFRASGCGTQANSLWCSPVQLAVSSYLFAVCALAGPSAPQLSVRQNLAASDGSIAHVLLLPAQGHAL